MILNDIAAKARNLVKADSNQYPDSKLLIDLNIWYQNVASAILQAQDESDFDDPNWGDYPSGTIQLTTNRDYAISTAERVLKMKTVNISYDGVNYYTSIPIDSGELEIGQGPASATANADSVDANFSRTNPRHDWKYGSLSVYPRATAADVAAGGKIFLEWLRTVVPFTSTDLTAGTLEPGFDSNFHHILSVGAAYEYALSNHKDNAETLKRDTEQLIASLKEHYSSKAKDRRYQLAPLLINYK